MKLQLTILFAGALFSALAAAAAAPAASAQAPGMGGCGEEAASAPMGDCMSEHMKAHMHEHMKAPMKSKVGAGQSQGHWGAGYTPGWMLMTPAERNSFAEKMKAAKNREECQALVDQQREEVATRAKAAGTNTPPRPRHAACSGFAKPAHEHEQEHEHEHEH